MGYVNITKHAVQLTDTTENTLQHMQHTKKHVQHTKKHMQHNLPLLTLMECSALDRQTSISQFVHDLLELMVTTDNKPDLHRVSQLC